MKRILQCTLVILAWPVISIAQNPAEDTPPFSAKQFYDLNIGTSLLILVVVTICTLVALLVVRNKTNRLKISLIISLGFLSFFVWYIYPIFTFKGIYKTYDMELGVSDRIDESYHLLLGENYPEVEFGYTLKPFRRMLWVNYEAPALEIKERIPVRLGWNKLERPVLMNGWTRFKKIK